MKISISKLLRRLWLHLDSRRRMQFFILFILTLINALAEVVSLGAIIPFLAVLTTPDKLFEQHIVADISAAVGIVSADQLVLPLSILFSVVILIAAAIRLLLLWATNRLSYTCGTDISSKVYQKTLYQSYSVHLARNSSEIISSITSKVSAVVGLLKHVILLVSSIVLMVFIMAALIAINPLVASVTVVSFGLAYYFVAWMSRRHLTNNSRLVSAGSNDVIKALQEGLGGIRDITLDGTQKIYCDIHRNADYSLRKAMGNNSFIAASPRYIMEALGMILIVLFAYMLNRQPEGIVASIPFVGALVLGAQRFLPALQQSYSAWAAIIGNKASSVDVLCLLDQKIPEEYTQPIASPPSFQDAIIFDKVSFSYAKKGPLVLNGMNLIINKGARVGFVGNTGCGKSTTLDILMGLLTPSKGQILIDGISLTNELRRAWQQNIAHVPQSIYLSDNTLAENIAFGVPVNDIDILRVKLAAQQASIAEFIENKPNGYQELVGERGVRLSGGQRQRIGIARALYKQASILVFDEATSALDNATEKLIMEAIDMLSRDLTIIIIAHRLTTVQHCDIIFELDKGSVVAQGSYQELLEDSPSFRKMANITSVTI